MKKIKSKDGYSLIFPYNTSTSPFEHSSVAEHKKMADQLIAFIDQNTK
ncbi:MULTISPECIES: hypothetical protein [Mucilaginibacter]|nr:MULTISPECIES: hypothetical protein [Mucilaginibacter]